MLPDRSKRYAGIDQRPVRLVLATPWQLILITVIMVGLLRVIFPHKALVEKLYHHDQLDELTLSYIENLYRAEPTNFDLTILLARARPNQSQSEQEQLLQSVLSTGNARQRGEARLLLLESFEKTLSTELSVDEKIHWTGRLIALLQTARGDDVSPELAGVFAAAAFRLERTDLGVYFLGRISPDHPVATLVDYAKEALGLGRYVMAAEYYFLARKHTPSLDDARNYYQKGIEALMASSRFKLAMQEAQRELGDLADDPPTLRFLARAALAAGEPQQAALYAQRLVFMDTTVPAPVRTAP
jgi:polysaccharide biosynthesis protein PelB